MVNNRPLSERELELIEFYGYCSLGMSPQKFITKWSLTYEQIAFICERSTTTVSLWFSKGNKYRRPAKDDLRHLAVMDFLLEHYEDIPLELRNLLCPPKGDK
ncbi:MAG TPA: helix-turn-helix domain-containing protein [Phormidium sp.]